MSGNELMRNSDGEFVWNHRDQLAIEAMKALIPTMPEDTAVAICDRAYLIADRMLKAREVPE